MTKKTAALLFAGITVLLTGCTTQPRNESANKQLETGTSAVRKMESTESTLPEEFDTSELPPYTYSGEEPYFAAVCEYFSDIEAGKERGGVYIPLPVILKAEKHGEETLLYGQFWDYWYEKRGDTLFCTGGGENTGRLHLTEKDGSSKVISFEQVGDGSDYQVDLKRICGDDEELYHRFFEDSQEFTERKSEKLRRKILAQYVADHGLDIKNYQDFGWPPVPIGDGGEDTRPSVMGKEIYRPLAGSGIGQLPAAKEFLEKEYARTDQVMYIKADMVNARILPSTEFEQAYIAMQIPRGDKITVVYSGDEWSGFYQNPEDQDAVLWVKTEYLTAQDPGAGE